MYVMYSMYPYGVCHINAARMYSTYISTYIYTCMHRKFECNSNASVPCSLTNEVDSKCARAEEDLKGGRPEKSCPHTDFPLVVGEGRGNTGRWDRG